MVILNFLNSCVSVAQATEVKVNEVEFNPQFVSRMIPKLEWGALVHAAEEVSQTSPTFIVDAKLAVLGCEFEWMNV